MIDDIFTELASACTIARDVQGCIRAVAQNLCRSLNTWPLLCINALLFILLVDFRRGPERRNSHADRLQLCIKPNNICRHTPACHVTHLHSRHYHAGNRTQLPVETCDVGSLPNKGLQRRAQLCGHLTLSLCYLNLKV